MKQSESDAEPVVEEPMESVRSFARGWDWFWFSPSDPTTLGLMRVLTGISLLYVYICYSFDLLSYVSPREAWLDQTATTELHKKAGVDAFPNGWPGNIIPGYKVTDASMNDLLLALNVAGVNGDEIAALSRKLEPLKGKDFATDEEFMAAISRVLSRQEMTEFGRSVVEYSQKRVPPSVEVAKGRPSWSIFFHLQEPASIWTAHILILIVLFLFTIGWETRITSVLAFIGATCYIWRARTSLFGMDSIISVLMLYLMIAPCGAAVSVDRWLEVWRERRRLRNRKAEVPLQPLVSATVATRLMQIHFCFIYIAAGTSKLLGAAWWNGTALWMCYANYSFAPLRVPLYYDFLVFLCQHRWLWEIAMSSGVIFTLFTELSFAFLVWLKRWRWVMLSCAVLFHTGIGLLMGLVTFSLMMLCLVLSFVPPEASRLFLTRVAENWQSTCNWLFRTGTSAAKPIAAPAR
jgi:hypothetical protein